MKGYAFRGAFASDAPQLGQTAKDADEDIPHPHIICATVYPDGAGGLDGAGGVDRSALMGDNLSRPLTSLPQYRQTMASDRINSAQNGHLVRGRLSTVGAPAVEIALERALARSESR